MQIPYVNEIGEDGCKHRTIEQRLRRFKGRDNRCKKVLCAVRMVYEKRSEMAHFINQV